MANWAFTEYVATGNALAVNRLHAVMCEVLCRDNWSHNLGGLISKIGGDLGQIDSRGSWGNLRLDNVGLWFDVESAWAEHRDLRHLIESAFPGIKILYLSEETDTGCFTTNDAQGKCFNSRFYLWVNDEDASYHESAQSLASEVSRIVGRPLPASVESCREALTAYTEFYTLEGYKILDD